jgi:hypothetical protein
MEALDQLLMACHCQSINLFVESFLKMVAKLLESEKPNLQILGTNSVRLALGPWVETKTRVSLAMSHSHDTPLVLVDPCVDKGVLRLFNLNK